MATGTLTGTTIASTYKSILKLGTNTAGDGAAVNTEIHATTLKVIEDGHGSNTSIQLAQNRVEIVPVANHANAFEVSQADGTQILNINSTTPAATLVGDLTVTGNTTITTSDNSDNLALVSTDADSETGPNISFWRNSSSPANGDHIGQINWYAENDADEKTHIAQIVAKIQDVADGTEDARFAIQTIFGGATGTSRVELLPTETIINQDSKDLDFRVESDVNAHMLFVDGGNNKIGIGTETAPSSLLHLKHADTGSPILTLENTAGTGTDWNIWSHNDGNLYFQDGSTSVLELTSAGDVQITGDIKMSDGKGIDFSADASPAAGMTSELLDDYEEGYYNAVFTCGTSGTITAHTSFDDVAYTKIGRVVHIQAYVDVSAVSSPVGELRVSLPFTATALTGQSDHAFGNVAFIGADLTDASSHGLFMHAFGGGAYAIIKYTKDASAPVNDLAGSIGAADSILFSLTYFVE